MSPTPNPSPRREVHHVATQAQLLVEVTGEEQASSQGWSEPQPSLGGNDLRHLWGLPSLIQRTLLVLVVTNGGFVVSLR